MWIAAEQNKQRNCFGNALWWVDRCSLRLVALSSGDLSTSAGKCGLQIAI